jgi:hypothetical protein
MKHLRYGLIAIFVLAFAAPAAWGFGSTGSCVGCHDGFPGPGPLHSAHTAFINSCTYCHTSVGDTPQTGSSGQDPENSCSGCHVLGGVVQHHITTGASGCGCHSGESGGLESDTPPYYGTAATSLRFSCFDGLDNDGDDLYDGGDPDCIGVDTEDRSWTVIKEIYGTE